MPTLTNQGQINLGGRLGLGDQYGPGALTNDAGATIDFKGRGYRQRRNVHQLGEDRQFRGRDRDDHEPGDLRQPGRVVRRDGRDAADRGRHQHRGDVHRLPQTEVELDGSGTWGGANTGSGGGQVVIALVAQALATIDADGATFDFPAGMLNWDSGTISGDWTNAGDLTITPTSDRAIELSDTLTNSGTIELTGTLNGGIQASVDNVPAGTVTLFGRPGSAAIRSTTRGPSPRPARGTPRSIARPSASRGQSPCRPAPWSWTPAARVRAACSRC